MFGLVPGDTLTAPYPPPLYCYYSYSWMSRREGVSRSNSCSPAPGVSWKDIPRDISLEELARRLVSRRWRDQHNLRLTAPERVLVSHSVLREQRRWPRPPDDGGGPTIDVFLLDNALLFVKENVRDGVFELYKPPIPLDLLLIPPDTHADTPSKQGTPVTFVHRGRGAGGASFTLFARSAALRRSTAARASSSPRPTASTRTAGTSSPASRRGGGRRRSSPPRASHSSM